jgi:iron complex outermembrane receptor protein
VLLNGRRIAPYGVALDNDDTFVDLNSLPLAAVDRVEVLRDGASAIYGADAIGGVVNIVLRRDFDGAETALQAGQSTHGDAGRTYLTATIGTGKLATDRYNAFLTIDALRQSALDFSARDFSRSADQRPRGGADWRSFRSFPPTIQVAGEDPMAAPGCPPERIAPVPFGPGTRCMFDANPYQQLLPKVERGGALAVGSITPVPAVRVYSELSAHWAHTESQIAASPTVTALLPAGAITNPFGQDVLVFSWRPVEIGPRRAEVDVEHYRAIVGSQGTWQRWDWDVAMGYSAVNTDFGWKNQVRTSAIQAGLDSGTLNPFIDTNDPAALAAVRVDALDRYRSRTSFLQAKASSDVAELAAGPLGLAIGAEGRRESFSTQLDPLILAGEIAGSGTAGTADAAAARTVTAAFVELGWPVVPGIELQLAARNDRYSDFGSSTSPKVAVRWQPAKSVLLRASAGRGFLPPSLQQVNKPRTELAQGIEDPIRCPVTQSPDDCGLGGFISQQGNPDLKPERSRQYNYGLVLAPVPALSISIDFWRIKHQDKIVFGDGYILEHEDQFPGRVVRAPASAADIALGLPGPIIELRDTYVNLADRDVRGADLELRYRGATGGSGALTLNATASYLDRFVERVTPDSAAEDKIGLDARSRLRANFGATWERGPWQTGINLRFIGGYRYDPGDGNLKSIPSWTVFDLTAAWRDERNELLLVARNVADREPPFYDSAYGYDPLVHDPVGRFLSLLWRHSF